MIFRLLLRATLVLIPSLLPAQELPPLSIARDAAGQVTLQWPTLPGQTYHLQSSPSLAAADWQTARAEEEATGLPMTFTETPGPGEAHRFYRLEVGPVKPLIKKIAVMGDSVTGQGSANLVHLSARGYFNWARLFGGTRWELVADPVNKAFCFYAGGKRSYQISAIHLPTILASDADVCVLAYGTNDAAQISTPEAYRAQIVADWAALRAAGIHPVAVTVLPIGSVGIDNTVRQALVVQLNAIVREESAIHNVPLCDWSYLMEAVPGSDNGVGLDSYYIGSNNYHPLPYPASMIGRKLHETLKKHFRFDFDPWENQNWITPNVAFVGTDRPNGWYLFPPAEGSVDQRSLIPSPEGNWWEFRITQGGALGNFYLNNFGENLGGPPTGRMVEGVVELQVMSGSIAGVTLQVGSALAVDMLAGGDIGAQIVPHDGIVALRTPPVLVPAGVTSVPPTLAFRTNDATATLRIRRCGIRLANDDG
jgi:lysophospholipase L1-like esterase